VVFLTNRIWKGAADQNSGQKFVKNCGFFPADILIERNKEDFRLLSQPEASIDCCEKLVYNGVIPMKTIDII